MAKLLDPRGTTWTIERDFARVKVFEGRRKVGDGTHANPLLARYHASELVRTKIAAGFKLVTEPRPADDFPSDDDARLVHADVLQQRGDPLGELIVMQHRGLSIDELVETHRHALFKDLAEYREHFRFTWRLGRLVKAEIRPTRDMRLVFTLGVQFILPTLVEALFDLPIARSLEELVIGTCGSPLYLPAMQAIREYAPPTLRRLEIDADATDDATLFPMAFPNLEELVCELDLSPQGLGCVANADMPKLHTLSIRMYGSTSATQSRFRPDDEAMSLVRQLLAPRGMPALRRLTLWTATPSTVARTLIDVAPTQFREIVIRSKLAIDPGIVLPPYARFEQQPRYSLR